MNRRDFLVGLFSLIPTVFLYGKMPVFRKISSRYADVPNPFKNENVSHIIRSIERQSIKISELPKANYCVVNYDTYKYLMSEDSIAIHRLTLPER